MQRAQTLFDSEQAQLAIQVLDVLLSAKPEHREGRKLHVKILEQLAREDFCLMSRNTYIHFIDQDKKILESS